MNLTTPSTVPTMAPSNNAFNNDITIIQLSINIVISIANLFILLAQTAKTKHFSCLFCYGCCFLFEDEVIEEDKSGNTPTTIPSLPNPDGSSIS
jgi:hypothetical protein